ncbi:MAG: valine--tRNA ligase [Clostridiales bacterium]|nr:valine--tRNA ligase [Clostridiales bacterium]
MTGEAGKELNTKYDPTLVEERWYQEWKDRGYFKAPAIASGRDSEGGGAGVGVAGETSGSGADAAGETSGAGAAGSPTGPFSIVIPPPNVTGSLHLGHAINLTLQDILVRYKRMQGYDTLWLPGTDHAGIATQAKVEEALAEDGISKHDLGREKFVDEVWEWKNRYHARIVEQLGRLGGSCDWERERFTLDEGCSMAVQEVFAGLYEKGLIYQGDYLINWCPKCQTTISDIEVEHEEEEGFLWHLRYPVKGEENRFLTVATTRPETMLGDTAVAVHPEDSRYVDLIGKSVLLPLMDREIPIIGDAMVDQDFGTGAVKVTPAHDINDFETGLRHGLAQISVMDNEARMNGNAGVYQGMDRYDARAKIIADLEALGLVEKIEAYGHAVGHCYRCGVVVEPMISKQWFVKMKPLAEPTIQAVKDGRIRFVPERFSRVFLSWMENVRDWCISRQLWWGHRIPVWYCRSCGEIICSKSVAPVECPKCASKQLEQDPDVLDTWFSSGLWPFSTMGWPEKTDDLAYYYPTSVLVTGRDIIFFWVARMAFLGLEFMGDIPFHDVLIHGLVLDAQGRKMSKSLGNGIDPIEVIESYGADTLRFTLVTGNTPGNDLRFQQERLEGTRNFCNKIWNACRFTLMNLAEDQQLGALELADLWIQSRYHRCAMDVTKALDEYDIGVAAGRIYEFLWDELCDWYIELVKPRLYGKVTVESQNAARRVLADTLSGTLALLHPFMPFITEELWQHLPHDGDTIMLQPWEEGDARFLDRESEDAMSLMMEVVKAARNLRSQFAIPPGKKADLIVYATDRGAAGVLERCKGYIMLLAAADHVEIGDAGDAKPKQAGSAVASGVEIYMPLAGLIDIEAEKARLGKELGKVSGEIKGLESKLANEGFRAKAPKEVVEKEEAKLDDARVRLQSLASMIAQYDTAERE